MSKGSPLEHHGLRTGGLRAALLVALAVSATSATSAAAEAVPWGAGCIPTPEGATRTAANCGASLVQGRAVAPPGAPPAVQQAIAAPNRIRHRPYVWGGVHVS